MSEKFVYLVFYLFHVSGIRNNMSVFATKKQAKAFVRETFDVDVVAHLRSPTRSWWASLTDRVVWIEKIPYGVGLNQGEVTHAQWTLLHEIQQGRSVALGSQECNIGPLLRRGWVDCVLSAQTQRLLVITPKGLRALIRRTRSVKTEPGTFERREGEG